MCVWKLVGLTYACVCALCAYPLFIVNEQCLNGLIFMATMLFYGIQNCQRNFELHVNHHANVHSTALLAHYVHKAMWCAMCLLIVRMCVSLCW